MKLDNQPGEFDQVEIRIFEGRVAKYRVEMRLATDRVVAHLPGLPAALQAAADARDYGRQLSEWLFAEDMREAFRRVRWAAESYNRSAGGVSGLRVRLRIEAACEELHPVMWETLADPGRDDPLALTTAFSRVANVRSAPAPTPRDRPLRMLLITASPQGLARFDLTGIDVDLERRVVQSAIGLAGQPVEVVRLGPLVSLDTIRSAEKQRFHIAHLVAHAVVDGDSGYLLLGDSAGTVQKVTCQEIASAMVSPAGPPALAYVATPTEGEMREAPTRLELGRLLIEAGVQAVVVIQAPMDPEGFALFTERFYSVLVQTGSVDQAMADARVAIYRPESWSWAYPVLLMRADAGELWTAQNVAFESLVQGIDFE